MLCDICHELMVQENGATLFKLVLKVRNWAEV